MMTPPDSGGSRPRAQAAADVAAGCATGAAKLTGGMKQARSFGPVRLRGPFQAGGVSARAQPAGAPPPGAAAWAAHG